MHVHLLGFDGSRLPPMKQAVKGPAELTSCLKRNCVHLYPFLEIISWQASVISAMTPFQQTAGNYDDISQ